MTEENKNEAAENQLTPEQLEALKKGVEEATSKTVSQQAGIPEQPATNPEKPANVATEQSPKYPKNIQCRCKMRFFLQNGTEYQNDIHISMDKIAYIQQQMASSLENKDGHAVIYLEGSKNCEADFTIIPVKNILYVKFEVEDFKKA